MKFRGGFRGGLSICKVKMLFKEWGKCRRVLAFLEMGGVSIKFSVQSKLIQRLCGSTVMASHNPFEEQSSVPRVC